MLGIKSYLCHMEQTKLLRAIFPDVLIDNFDVLSFDKTEAALTFILMRKSSRMMTLKDVKKHTQNFVLTKVGSRFSHSLLYCPHNLFFLRYSLVY